MLKRDATNCWHDTASGGRLFSAGDDPMVAARTKMAHAGVYDFGAFVNAWSPTANTMVFSGWSPTRETP